MRHVIIPFVIVTALVGCKPKPEPEPTAEPTPAPVAEPTPTTELTPEPETPEPETPVPSGPGVEERLRDAVAQLAAEQPAAAVRAEQMLTELLKRNPDNAYIHFNLGVAKQQQQEHDAAKRYYEAALGLEPSLSSAHVNLGILAEADGRPTAAARNYKAAIAADPDDTDARVALISVLRRTGRLDEAVTAAKEALRINSKSLPVFNALGLVYLAKNDLGMANFVYQKAVGDIDGALNNPEIRTNMAWTMYLRDDPWAAQKNLEKAVELDSQYVPALVYLSHLYLDNKNYADSVPLLERAFEQVPDNHGVLLNLGLSYRGVGRYQDAKRMYELALKEMPENPAPHMNLGVLLGDYLKDYDGAIEAFESYIDRGGDRRDDAEAYIAKVEKEQKKVAKEKKRAAESERRRKEKEERERLLKEAENRGSAPTDGTEAPTGGDTPPPSDDSPASPPADEGAAPTESPAPTDPEQPPSPWGTE